MIDPRIDWNEVWKNQIRRSRESGPGRERARIWESKESAKRFWKESQESKELVEKTIEGLDIHSRSRVLDIGAGPGAVAIPLAKKISHVTAVEPSEGMVSIMRDKLADFGIENIYCVQKPWEEVDVKTDLFPPYDVVLAAFSLGMPDIRGAIMKMLEASSRYVYLYWFAGDTPWDIRHRGLWPKLHGEEYHPAPKCDVLYNALYQMGIYPNITTFCIPYNQRFLSLEEAISYFRPQCQVTTKEQESILSDHLSQALQKENGSLVLRGSSIRVRMWWDKTD